MKERSTTKNIAVTLTILAICTLVGRMFFIANLSETNIVAFFIQGVLLIAILTQGAAYSFISSFLSLVIVNYLFVKPYNSFRVERDYVTTLVIMFLISLVIAWFTAQFKKTREAKEAIEKKVAGDEFRYNIMRSISHDLKTPLTGINGIANLLLHDEGKLSEEKKDELYRYIESESTWLNNMIENLLAVSKIGEDSVRLTITSEDVSEIVGEALSHIDNFNLESSGIHIETDIPHDALLADMDAKLVVQVLINLINNAIKHAHGADTISISAREDGADIRISVADNGCGIDENLIESLYEPFKTGDEGQVDSRRGFGLGLYLCRSIVEACGGTIEYRNNNPKGAVFEFTLPKSEIKELQ